MRFILFIALALLPLSAAVKCYEGTESKGPGEADVTPSSTVTCDTKYCKLIVKQLDPPGSRETRWTCGNKLGVCEQEGCKNDALLSREVCCCTTDNCNASKATASVPAPPTPPPASTTSSPNAKNPSPPGPASLLSLAAAAAMIAARV